MIPNAMAGSPSGGHNSLCWNRRHHPSTVSHLSPPGTTALPSRTRRPEQFEDRITGPTVSISRLREREYRSSSARPAVRFSARFRIRGPLDSKETRTRRLSRRPHHFKAQPEPPGEEAGFRPCTAAAGQGASRPLHRGSRRKLIRTPSGRSQ
jgi:hypothetical protein